MTIAVVILCLVAGVALAVMLGRGRGAAVGHRVKNWLASVLVRAEARGDFEGCKASIRISCASIRRFASWRITTRWCATNAWRCWLGAWSFHGWIS